MTLFAICTSIGAESFSNEPKLSTSNKVTKLVRFHEKQSTLNSQGSRRTSIKIVKIVKLLKIDYYTEL